MTTPTRRSLRISAGRNKQVKGETAGLKPITEDECQVHSLRTKSPYRQDLHMRVSAEKDLDVVKQHDRAATIPAPIREKDKVIAEDVPRNDWKASVTGHPKSFEFRFDAPESELSSEARYIMNNVRREAERIKGTMNSDKCRSRSPQEHAFGISPSKKTGNGTRKRFSDLHNKQFHKMVSITQTPALAKCQDSVDSKATQFTTGASLKRSASKASLADNDNRNRAKQSKSKFRKEGSEGDAFCDQNPRFGCTEHKTDLGSNRCNEVLQTSRQRASKFLPSAIMTPTKASLARSISAKADKSLSARPLCRVDSERRQRQHAAKTEGGSAKRLASLQRFGGNMRSILHQPLLKYSRDPAQIAAGTHLPLPDDEKKWRIDVDAMLNSPSPKRVQFSNSTKDWNEADSANVATSSHPSVTSTCPRNPVQRQEVTAIKYPKIENPSLASSQSSSAGNFTFRSNMPISFEQSNRSALPTQTGNTNDAFVCRLPGAFVIYDDTSNETPVASGICHGSSNKKRKHFREDLREHGHIDGRRDLGNGQETISFSHDERENENGPMMKKLCMTKSPGLQKSPIKTPSLKSTASILSPRFNESGPPKRGISASRLEMLARPKRRV